MEMEMVVDAPRIGGIFRFSVQPLALDVRVYHLVNTSREEIMDPKLTLMFTNKNHK
jgi:hypothetical protein